MAGPAAQSAEAVQSGDPDSCRVIGSSPHGRTGSGVLGTKERESKPIVGKPVDTVTQSDSLSTGDVPLWVIGSHSSPDQHKSRSPRTTLCATSVSSAEIVATACVLCVWWALLR